MTEKSSDDQVENVTLAAGVDEDRQRIEAWHAAADLAPKEGDRNALRVKVSQLRDELAETEEEYARACVQSAAVFGWTTIAAEQEVSSKQLHQWRRRYLPDIEDLSMVPEREMRREERRVEEIKRKLEQEAQLKERLAAHEARMNRIAEVLHGK